MEKVFVDTDIVIDLLAQREPFYIFAAELFSMADKRELKLFVSPLTFANVNYLLTRQFSADKARKALLKFKAIINVLTIDDKIIELALTSDFKDFEDGIQYYTAIENNIKLILTRNLKDFKSATIPVLTSEQYIKGRK